MRQLAEVIDVSILKSAGMDEESINSLMANIESVLKLEVKRTGSKLHLNIKFIEGPYANKTFQCESNKERIVFGSVKDMTEAQHAELGLQNCQYVYIEGARIVQCHFQIFYDPLQCGLLMQNLNYDCSESCGVYMKMA